MRWGWVWRGVGGGKGSREECIERKDWGGKVSRSGAKPGVRLWY